MCIDFHFLPVLLVSRITFIQKKISFQAKVVSDEISLSTWREISSWKHWLLPYFLQVVLTIVPKIFHGRRQGLLYWLVAYFILFTNIYRYLPWTAKRDQRSKWRWACSLPPCCSHQEPLGENGSIYPRNKWRQKGYLQTVG